MFEPEKNTWVTKAEKPTEEQIEQIKAKISGAGKPEPAEDTAEKKQKTVEEAGAGEQPLTEEEIKKKEQKK